MMINRYFSKAKKSSQTFWGRGKEFLVYLQKEITSFFHNIKNLNFRIKNLTGSNLDLGVYHLRCRNYNDAIFRFKLVDKFLEPGNKIANYWLGWVYFMQKKYHKAIQSLQKSQAPEAKELIEFIHKIDHADSVPEYIYSMCRDIMAEKLIEPYLRSEINIASELVSSFNFYASNLPENYQIIEFGSNMGILSSEIRGRMQPNYQYTVIEPSQKMLELTNLYFPKIHLHDFAVNVSIEKFIASSQQKFDVIYSLNSLNSRRDLETSFSCVANLLNQNGYFAFAIQQASKTHLDKRTMQFIYEQSEIIQKLEASGLRILYQKEIFLVMESKYSIFVCVKPVK